MFCLFCSFYGELGVFRTKPVLNECCASSAVVMTQMYDHNSRLPKEGLVMVCFVFLGADLDAVGSGRVSIFFVGLESCEIFRRYSLLVRRRLNVGPEAKKLYRNLCCLGCWVTLVASYIAGSCSVRFHLELIFLRCTSKTNVATSLSWRGSVWVQQLSVRYVL